MPGPLEGYRVLDWTVFQQGPTAAALLADMGADVIKIEPPAGESGRGLGKILGMDLPLNFYYQNQNRGKRGIVLDMTKERGRGILYKLVERSDVFVTNYRYVLAKKYGIDYDNLRRYNPKLIYALSTGYGLHGPDADLPSADIAGQARGGVMSISCGTEDGIPAAIGGGFGDEAGGLVTAYGVVLALLARERYGVGQMVEASLMGSVIEMCRLWLQFYLIGRRSMPGSVLGMTRSSAPLWNMYKCQDDKWLVLSVLQVGKYWAPFCKAMEIEELTKEEFTLEKLMSFEVATAFVLKLREIFATKPRDEWLKALAKEEVPASPVNEMADLENDPQVIANEYIVEVDDPIYGKVKVPGIPAKLSETPGKVRRLAPELGQHTEEVLMEVLGYTWDDLAKLREEGVY